MVLLTGAAEVEGNLLAALALLLWVLAVAVVQQKTLLVV
jgi:hypothetical protein